MHSIGTEEMTNAKTSNMDKMTEKQLLSDLSESHTFGTESSGLGTAAWAKRGTVAACIGTGSDASESDDDGPARPVKNRAAATDSAYRAFVLARPEPVDYGQRQLGLREAEHQGFFEVHSSKNRSPRVITACPRTTRMNTRSFQSSLAVGWQSSTTSGQASRSFFRIRIAASGIASDNIFEEARRGLGESERHGRSQENASTRRSEQRFKAPGLR